jgi:hypothetical protein
MDQLTFAVPANSPLPFPNPPSAAVLDHYVVQVENTGVSLLPAPSVILAGHATSNDPPTPFGNITGAGVTLTFGYKGSGSSVQFGPIMESVSPLYNLYSPAGVGSLSLTPSLQTCSNATLKGTYIFTLGGSVQTGSTFQPYAETGRFSADGAGNITVLDSGNQAGQVFQSRTFPIAYTVDANCGGIFNFGGSSMDVQVSRDGTRLNMVFTKPSYVVASGAGSIQ